MKNTIKFLFLIIINSAFGQVTDTGGNVGIGITTPQEKLDVNGNIMLQGYTGTNDGALSALKFFNNYTSTNSVLAQIQARRGQSHFQKGDLAFYVKNGTSLVETLRIVSNGNVGIGTVTAENLLHIKHSGSDYALKIQSNSYTDNSKALIKFATSGTANVSSAYIGALRIPGGFGKADIIFGTNSVNVTNDNISERMRITNIGNVGIGTTNPNYKLSVANGVFNVEKNGDYYGFWVENKLRTDNPKINLGAWYNNRAGISYNYPGNYLTFDTQNSTTTYSNTLVLRTGNVGIGTTDTKGFKLGVQGKIAAEEVKVAVYANWADFVFNKNYNLPTLKDVEQHIKDRGHLKDIPSAKDVKKNGIFLGEMDAKLLQKIEELTLYAIQQQKAIEAQNNEIQLQKEKTEKLEKENKFLKSLLERVKKLEEKIKS